MPYPLTDGGAIGIYNITKFLARAGHEVTLVTYPLDTKDATETACHDISKFARLELVDRPLPARWRALLRSTVLGGAYPIVRRMMPEMDSLLRSVASSHKFDILHVDHAHMGRYGLMLSDQFGLPSILREHNVESQIYRRFAASQSNPVKRLLAQLHGRRLLREETTFLQRFDAVAAISSEDAGVIRSLAPSTVVEVIPAGVDCDHFLPADLEEETQDSVLWVGGMAWDPNRDALQGFLSDIWPAIKRKCPSATLDIVGEGTEQMSAFASNSANSVQIHGRVPDIRDYLRRSAVLVVPLRVGGGMRLKLVEFFAAGKAVVSTTIGAEGNRGIDGRELVIRDEPDEFATAVVQLLGDPSRRHALGQNARALATKEYSWTHIADRFEQLYERVLRKA